MCREFNWSTVLDRHLQRQVQALRVFCHYKTSECEWQGEILGLLPHVLADHEGKFSVPFINEIGNTEYSGDVINLMQAVYSRDKEEVKSLLSKRADPNAFPLMIEFSPLMQASKVGTVEIARLLLNAGANPNLANDEGQTALIIASTHGHCDVAELLLEKGANPDMQNNDRWTALMAAVYSNHNNIALKVIEAGATPHIQDKNYTNALLLAVDKESEEVLNALLDHVDLRFPFQLDIQDSRGDTTLIMACRKRNLKLVRRLLSMKANPNISNFNGETPRIIARKLDEKGVLQELSDNHVTSELVKLSPLETELEEAAPLSALQILEGDNIIVSGAPLLNKQSFVYTGRKMAFFWEDAGINLHFPAAACEEEIKISVKVLTNVEDNCIMPDGYRLMPFASAVYKITASAKLSAPVKVRMQHCAVVDKEGSLVHIVAHCTSPYRFKLLHKGKFPLGDTYGEIEISRFSVLGTIFNFLGLVSTLAIHVGLQQISPSLKQSHQTRRDGE
ncbi:Ankyrin homolog [Geodia barretti]|uniref:Ankyrin homolog n=1 Tax=Geodia barretti TaxID=519541 RepID=A0AA35SRK4_GEOBA|nr:Ankyrin homolog [Geodia barretti]